MKAKYKALAAAVLTQSLISCDGSDGGNNDDLGILPQNTPERFEPGDVIEIANTFGSTIFWTMGNDGSFTKTELSNRDNVVKHIEEGTYSYLKINEQEGSLKFSTDFDNNSADLEWSSPGGGELEVTNFNLGPFLYFRKNHNPKVHIAPDRLFNGDVIQGTNGLFDYVITSPNTLTVKINIGEGASLPANYTYKKIDHFVSTLNISIEGQADQFSIITWHNTNRGSLYQKDDQNGDDIILFNYIPGLRQLN